MRSRDRAAFTLSNFFLGFIFLVHPALLDAMTRANQSMSRRAARLVISIVGAGEPANYSKNPSQSMYEHVPGNRHSGEASRHLSQFTAGKDAILPSKHIVLTSDPELKSWVKRLPFHRKSGWLVSGGLCPNCSQICSRSVVGGQRSGQGAIVNKSRLYHAFNRGTIISEARVSGRWLSTKIQLSRDSLFSLFISYDEDAPEEQRTPPIGTSH